MDCFNQDILLEMPKLRYGVRTPDFVSRAFRAFRGDLERHLHQQLNSDALTTRKQLAIRAQHNKLRSKGSYLKS